MPANLSNWAGNVTFTAREQVRPTSVGQLQEVVAAQPRLRALGTGHSFNRIADSPGALVTLDELQPPITVDAAAGTATVPAGARYAQVAAALHQRGWALHNLGSLPHISVGGACATATHGSGVGNSNLAGAAVGLELVRADGELIRLRDGDPDFPAAAVSLGALGIVTQLTLRIEPTYQVRQDVYLDLPLAALVEHGIEILSSAYSVSVFTTWHRPDTIDSVWLKARVPGPHVAAPRWWGARRAERPQHPIPGLDPAAASDQLGVPGPWHQRLPHFRPEFTPSSGHELQSEFFLPRETFPDALLALQAHAGELAAALQVCEMRAIAADDLWLSPCYRRDAVAVHATWVSDLSVVEPALRTLQATLAPFGPRPHWAKLFLDQQQADIAGYYPRLADFQAVVGSYDPDHKFGNAFLERYLY